PSKNIKVKNLECNSCGKILPLEDDIEDSYIFTKEIHHPPGEEFKNLEKMEIWKEQEIYSKFKK
ncbi:MAG: hypothetical protein ACFFE5_10045, partial [Candidatus Thorarchaeota archaeon]